MLKELMLKQIEKMAQIKLSGAMKDLAIEAEDQIINSMNQQPAGVVDAINNGGYASTVSPYDKAVFDPTTGKWRLIDRSGYARLYDEKPSIKNWLRYEYEHRKVMREMMGREIALNEIIHHLDGNRSNNTRDNLKLVIDHIAHMREEHPEWRKGLTGREKLSSADLNSISFPKNEWGHIKDRLNSGKDVVTLRVENELGKYKVGKIYRTPWGTEVEVVDKKTGIGAEHHQFKDKITSEQMSQVKGKDSEYITLRAATSKDSASKAKASKYPSDVYNILSDS